MAAKNKATLHFANQRRYDDSGLRWLSFARELCVAIAHRWEAERLFVIITGYLDEGHTHDGSPVTVVGGAMASARQWEAFEGAYRIIKREYGFKVFHTRKFKHKTGEFKGWSNEKCIALVEALYELTSNAFMESAVAVLDNAAYEAEYKTGEKPKKLRLDSKYGICVHNCLMHFVVEAARRKHRGQLPTLHCVLESGHKNAGDALRIFNEIKRDLKGSEYDLLGELTFAAKEECDPLMAGDFLALSQGVREIKTREGKPISQDDGTTPSGKRDRLTIMRYKPGALANVRRSLIDGYMKRTTMASVGPSSPRQSS
jgi:hypothetical protein